MSGLRLLDYSYALIKATGGTSRKTLGDRFGDLLNLKHDFNALGNDATADTAALQAAAASGRSVWIPPGTYLTSATANLVSGTRLFGFGATIKKAASSTHHILTAPNTVDGVIVQGLSFDGNRRDSAAGAVFWCDDAKRIVFTENIIYNSSSFWCEGGTDIWVTKNRFYSGRSGIACGTDVNTPFTRNLWIEHNTIFDTEDEPIDLNFNFENVFILGNKIQRGCTVTPGELIDVGGGTSTNVVIAGNILDGDEANGGGALRGVNIKLGTSKVIVADNHISNLDQASGGAGILLSSTGADIKVTGNVVDGAWDGIACTSAASKIDVSGNTVRNVADDGIDFQAFARTSVRIVDNTLLGGGTAAGTGMEIRSCTGLLVRGNSATGFGARGANIAATNADVQVLGNNFDGNTSDGAFVAAVGAVVEGNRCARNAGSGFQFSATTHASIVANKCFDNGVNGFQIAGAFDFSIVMGNHAYDTRSAGSRTQLVGVNIADAADRCTVLGNVSYNNVTAQISGTGTLTNSQVANNVDA